MTWSGQLDLFIDVAKFGSGSNPLIQIRGDSIIAAPTPTIIQGDHIKVRLFFRQVRTDLSVEPVGLPEGTRIVLAAKRAGASRLEGLLFSATNFALESDGADQWWWSWLDLNTQELADAIGTSDSIRTIVDIEVQNPDNSRRATFQFPCIVLRQSYAGEGNPTPAAPPYPEPSAIVTKISGSVMVEPGADSYTVSDLALDQTPAQVLLTLRKPSADAPHLTCSVVGTPTQYGFTIGLSAATPSGGYRVDYLLILP